MNITPGDQFLSYPRRGVKRDKILLHEPVAGTVDKTVRILKARGLGVHFIVDPKGNVTQHADVALKTYHAGKLNGRTIAIEVVNAYYGDAAPDDDTPEIQAAWAHRGWYILPTENQCEGTWELIQHLTSTYDIPLKFDGEVEPGAFKWGRLPLLKRLRPPAGVGAHAHYEHADGLFIEHYAMARFHGYSDSSAWLWTKRLAEEANGNMITRLP